MRVGGVLSEHMVYTCEYFERWKVLKGFCAQCASGAHQPAYIRQLSAEADGSTADRLTASKMHDICRQLQFPKTMPAGCDLGCK